MINKFYDLAVMQPEVPATVQSHYGATETQGFRVYWMSGLRRALSLWRTHCRANEENSRTFSAADKTKRKGRKQTQIV